ncbi:phosphatase PAP2 family protein [Advenella sp. EE-W14]|uniref:phosphatase PAP2 family protein n=1 Tax=Advenella sp. EE-W14 TaxID=2722705 RepID=UPI00145C5EAE|nr:phosphatase PAP2 family protein [Advenella sp. EE-W14]
MTGRAQFNCLDLKIGGLLFGSVILYAIIVFAISPITLGQFLPLVWTYGKTLPIAFLAILLITQVAGIITLGVKTKCKASPFAFCYQNLKQKWQQDRFLSLIWPIATLIILIPSFNVFKQTILSKQGFTTDPLLADLDFFLFQGDPGLILHSFIGSLETTLFIDNLYHAWFLPMILGVFLVSIKASPTTRIRYMSCYVFSWVFIGSILAWLFPSAGPCFYIDLVNPNHEGYSKLMSQLYAYHQEKPVNALIYQQYLAESFGKEKLTIGGGISAMPSVHVALATLFALGSFSINKWLGYVMSFYALFIWLGSVYLGWHYFVDGFVSVILIGLFWKWLLVFEKIPPKKSSLIIETI